LATFPASTDGILPRRLQQNSFYLREARVQRLPTIEDTVISKGKAKGKDAEMAFGGFRGGEKLKGAATIAEREGHKTVDCWAK
jgi:hypothetical protein